MYKSNKNSETLAAVERGREREHNSKKNIKSICGYACINIHARDG